MSILDRKLLRDMRSRRATFFAVAAMSLLGVALFVATYDAYQNLLASYDEVFRQTHFADIVSVGGDASAIAAEVGQLAGVASVSTREVADVPMRISDHKLLGRVVETPAGEQPAVDAVLPLTGASTPGEGVLVEQHFASSFGLRPGSTLEILGESWTSVRVVAVVASAEYLWPARSRQEVFVSPDDFGVVFAPPSIVSQLPDSARTPQTLVLFAAGADRPRLTRTIDAIASAHGAGSTFTKADQTSNAALHEDIAGFGELSVLFPLLFLGAGALATYVLLARLVRSQRPQIGLLLANGFSTSTVFRHYVSYGLLATFAGGVPGAALGALLGREITGEYTSELALPLRIVNWHPTTMLIGVLVALLSGGLAALVPALAASRLAPAHAMRAVPESERGSASLVERLLPPLRRVPIRWRLVPRSMQRNVLRSLATIVGTTLAVTLVLVSWGMLDTTQVLLDRQFAQIQREDADLLLAGTASSDTLTTVRSMSGVAGAEPFDRVHVSVAAAGRSYATDLVAYEPSTQMHTFLAPDGSVLHLPESAVLVGDAMREKLGVREGDEIVITLDTSGARLRERIGGFVAEPMGTFVYASLDQVAPASLEIARGIAVRYDRSVGPSSMRDRLSSLPDVVAFVDTHALARLANEYMGLFYVFVGAMLALGAVMSFALIFTTMSVNVAERSSEIATLRAQGMTQGEIGRTLAAENLLLTAIALPPGLAIGYGAAWAFMRSFSNDQFRFELTVRPLTFVIIGLATLAVAAVSQWPALRIVRSIDIGREIRVLSS